MTTEWLILNGNSDFSKSVTLTVEAETIKQSTKILKPGVRLEPDVSMLPHINALLGLITTTCG